MASILVVDAENASRSTVANELRALGHSIEECANANAALHALEQRRPDLMLLEWSLPDIDGIELLTDVKHGCAQSATRVLMTSARGIVTDVVQALDSGADDFVAKPYSIPEILARVSACLRRPANAHSSDELRAGGIKIDIVGHRVFVNDDLLPLAPREYRLLEFLVSNRDRVFSRRQLMTHVWERSANVGVRTVDVHVRRLRSLLEPYGLERFVQTVRGSGYRFSPE